MPQGVKRGKVHHGFLAVSEMKLENVMLLHQINSRGEGREHDSEVEQNSRIPSFPPKVFGSMGSGTLAEMASSRCEPWLGESKDGLPSQAREQMRLKWREGLN